MTVPNHRLAYAVRPLASVGGLFVNLGRFVVNFGFGSLVDKFEEHFGKWPTNLLLFVIGLTVAAACADNLWKAGFGAP